MLNRRCNVCRCCRDLRPTLVLVTIVIVGIAVGWHCPLLVFEPSVRTCVSWKPSLTAYRLPCLVGPHACFRYKHKTKRKTENHGI
ncbi:hypothetical protein GMOD_00004953 [Pyrenophora seminiperda CCB06]|uniref:Uncharacterized protein n=1 Tax=Pyrenophora seminiperda CCB06 TaxID=1302712 RepID=A0A3M7MHY4_9PLEO|nr:hypothetical protein GMOD_00004953 [Pyrenophora seminiperda CCB06]